jgi:CRP-like cAMP-binding protein
MRPQQFNHYNYSFNNRALFADLPDDVLALLYSTSTVDNYPSATSIFVEGESPRGIYRVKSGKVKKHARTNFGTEHIFYICGEGEYLGYHALMSMESYPDSATAMTDCEIEFVPKEAFLLALDKSHALTKRLLKNLSHEFTVFINATRLLAKHTVRERTALNLLVLEEKFKGLPGVKTEIIINRDDLASMVGTAKESVVRVLKDFKEEELIMSKGRSIFILNTEGLLKACNLN